MEIVTMSSRGKAIGKRFRNDKSVPGQRCITYSDYEETAIKQNARQEKENKHNKLRTEG